MARRNERLDRESFTPCTATPDEIRQAIGDAFTDDPELFVEDNIPEHIEAREDVEDWMNDTIEEMQSLLANPSVEVDAILRACRDRALEWMRDQYPPAAFLDFVAAHEHLLMYTRFEFGLEFFRGGFDHLTGVIQ